jgi:hypothetical protein
MRFWGAGCTNRLKAQGNRILFGCWLLVTCHWLLDAECLSGLRGAAERREHGARHKAHAVQDNRVLFAGYLSLVTCHSLLVTCHWSLVAGYEIQFSQFQIPFPILCFFPNSAFPLPNSESSHLLTFSPSHLLSSGLCHLLSAFCPLSSVLCPLTSVF